MGWLTERVTHHGAGGKFCSPGAATTVTKDGERYKIVRQHRRLKPRVPVVTAEGDTRQRGALALARASLRGWINLTDLIEGTLPYRLEGLSKDGATLGVVFPARPVRFPVIEFKGKRWSALSGRLAEDGRYHADYRKGI